MASRPKRFPKFGTPTALLVGVTYALTVVAMTWPAVVHLPDRLIGNNVDNWLYYWNDWWLERVFLERRSPFATPYMYYPTGTSLASHANSFTNSLMALPLRWIVGPISAHNLAFLLGLWLAAMGMFLFIRDVTRSAPAAFVAGFAFAFAPYHLTQRLGHGHLGAIQWWPFYALVLRRALCRRGVRPALAAGVFLAITAWSGLHLALLILIWTAAYVAWYLVQNVRSFRNSWRELLAWLGRVALVGAVAAVLCAPLLYAVATDLGALVDAAEVHRRPTVSQTDVLAYVVLPSYHPVFGGRVHRHYERFIVNRAYMPYIGFGVLALAGAGVARWRKESSFWVASLVCWVVLAAGPALRANGQLFEQVRLPYYYLQGVFPFSALRSPDRLNLLTAFSFAVLAGLGAAHLASRIRWLPIAMGAIVVFEYLCVPLPMWELPVVSPFTEKMAAEEATYAVVDYPMGYTISKFWLFFQTFHGKPTVEGHVSRYTREQYEFIGEQPLLNALYRVAERPPFLPPDTVQGRASRLGLGPALRGLDGAGVRYVLVHKPFLDAESEAHLQHVLPGVPTYEDEVLAVYDILDPHPVCYDGLPVSLTPGIDLLRFDVQPPDAGGQWSLQVVTALSDSQAARADCRIQLVGNEKLPPAVPVAFFDRAGEDWTWQQGDLDAAAIMVSMPPVSSPGTYRWSLTCPPGDVYLAPEELSRSASGMESYLRRHMDVMYGDAIRLAGYRWRTAGAALEVTLLWHAETAPQVDYKVFVHLLDRDGALVRQHDSFPCDWECPTGQWQAGHTIVDRAMLSIWGLAPGRYSVAVGMYGPDSMDRLAAESREGSPIPNGYLILPDEFEIARCASVRRSQ
jgi:hypothetical protein